MERPEAAARSGDGQNSDKVAVLRAVRSFALHLATLKKATMAFFNRLLVRISRPLWKNWDHKLNNVRFGPSSGAGAGRTPRDVWLFCQMAGNCQGNSPSRGGSEGVKDQSFPTVVLLPLKSRPVALSPHHL